MAELTGKDFWGRIYAEQYKQKITDSALSDMSGIPYGTIHTQKARQTLPKADILLALCKALNVSADYLLTGEVKQDLWNHQCILDMQQRYTHVYAEAMRPVADRIDELYCLPMSAARMQRQA